MCKISFISNTLSKCLSYYENERNVGECKQILCKRIQPEALSLRKSFFKELFTGNENLSHCQKSLLIHSTSVIFKYIFILNFCNNYLNNFVMFFNKVFFIH